MKREDGADKEASVLENNMKNQLFSKKTKIGTYSAVISLVVIAIVIVINMCVGTIPTTYTKFDTSSKQLYTISEQTEYLVRAIDEEITVYFIAETGAEDQTVSELLGRYSAINPKITIKYKDPVTDPNFIARYTDENISSNSLIFESEKRSRVINYSDLTYYQYVYGSDGYPMYDSNGQPITETFFNGESRITGAIQYVASDRIPKLYMLTGHGETALSADIQSYIKDDNIDVEELNFLLSGGVPEDADCVVINVPTSDLESDEALKLIEFMKNGGNVIVNYSRPQGSMPNLQKIFDYYGAQMIDGTIIETDANHYYSYPFYLLPTIEENGITDILGGTSFYVFLPGSNAVSVKEIDGVKITPLLSTSDGSYLKPYDSTDETMEKSENDIDGPFYVGVRLSEGAGIGGGLTVFASPYIADSNADYLSGGGNSAYFISTINYLCEKEASVSIAAKSMSVEALVVPTIHTTFWAVIMIAVIPLVFVVCGFVVWYRRKRS